MKTCLLSAAENVGNRLVAISNAKLPKKRAVNAWCPAYRGDTGRPRHSSPRCVSARSPRLIPKFVELQMNEPQGENDRANSECLNVFFLHYLGNLRGEAAARAWRDKGRHLHGSGG
jgi:hypothetical protein